MPLFEQSSSPVTEEACSLLMIRFEIWKRMKRKKKKEKKKLNLANRASRILDISDVLNVIFGKFNTSK